MKDGNLVTLDEFKKIATKGFKKSKYRAIPTTVDGIRFASKKEARVYGDLKIRKQSGEIKDFRMQVRYPIVVNNIHVCFYVADFVVDYPDGKKEVIDAKGVITPVYRLKKALMLAANGIIVSEV